MIPSPRGGVLPVAFAVAVACAVGLVDAGPAAGAKRDEAALVYAIGEAGGGKVRGRRVDEPINPASVVKLATTLRALETLGPDHRFSTGFELDGSVDRATRTLHGDLVVVGGGDPDFHVENAYLVARELNRADVSEVTGTIRIEGPFWIGWEGGAAASLAEPDARRERMADRLREALDPDRWTAKTRRSIEAFERRRGFDTATRPRIVVHGRETPSNSAPRKRVATHLSGMLRIMLKRFNAYSNNDIERFEATIGDAGSLARWVHERVGGPAIRFETLSGLGTNRMTPRQILRLLAELEAACEERLLSLSDLLPVAGCDPGTLEGLGELSERARGAVVAKTGTLTETDGGVSVLAGTMRAREGIAAFAAAIRGSGRDVASARRRLESWLLERLDRAGGAAPAACGPSIVHSDRFAEVRPTD